MTNKIEVTNNCWFEDIGCGETVLTYVEHATDYWGSDSETTVDIDKEMAENIIGWLQDKFDLKTKEERAMSKMVLHDAIKTKRRLSGEALLQWDFTGHNGEPRRTSMMPEEVIDQILAWRDLEQAKAKGNATSDEYNNRPDVGYTELLSLKIRNLIAEREFNTAQANRELAVGIEWLSDHADRDAVLASQIEELFQQANNTITNKENMIRKKGTNGLMDVFVTANLRWEAGCRQGWVISEDPLRILGASGTEYDCDDDSPVIVLNPPKRCKEDER